MNARWDEERTIAGALAPQSGPAWLRHGRSGAPAKLSPMSACTSDSSAPTRPNATVGQVLAFEPSSEGSGSSPSAAGPATRPAGDAVRPFQLIWREDAGVAAGSDDLLAERPRAALGELALRCVPRSGGRIDRTLVVVEGCLAPMFSVQARLSTMLSVLGHVVAAGARSARLAAAMERAAALAAQSGVPCEIVADACDVLLAELPSPATQALLLRHVTNELLRRRAHERCEVLGDSKLVARLGQGPDLITCYLPACVAPFLPLRAAFDALLWAEVLPSQEDGDVSSLCLRVLGLARVLAQSLTR